MANGVVEVAIVASGACHACRARELCGMSEQSEKLIEVECSEAERFSVGDVVTVAEEQRMALKAVLLAYVGALVVLLAALVIALRVGVGELGAVGCSLLSLALYYVVLYLRREKIKQTIHFTITKN